MNTRIHSAADMDGAPAKAKNKVRAQARKAGHDILAAAMVLTVCALPVYAAAQTTSSSPLTPQLINNSKWELTGWKLANGSMRAIPQGSSERPTLELSAANEASGFSSCNRYWGEYTLGSGKLSLGPFISTRRGCSASLLELERDYLAALDHVTQASMQIGAPQQLWLTLNSGDKLTFERSAK